MKILIISDAWLPQLNGVVRTYQYLKQELEKQGHRVHILGPRDFDKHFPMPGYKEIDLAWRPYAQMKRHIEAIQPDIIHIATEGPLGWAARKYCLRHSIRFSTSYHTQFPDYIAKRFSRFVPFFYKPIWRLGVAIIKKFHAPANALLITTKSMTEELRSWGIKTPIYPLGRGIDTTVFTLAAPSLFQELKKPIALYVGRLAVEKNLEEFLKMPWHGDKVLVGHGPDADMLKAKYPSAHFVGKKTGAELAAHYQSADVFVFPSRTDTFGIVLIEALACGLPVAAHNVIGPKDVIIKPELGVLSENLSEAAQKALLVGTPQMRHDYAISHYTWEAAAAQFMAAQKQIKITSAS